MHYNSCPISEWWITKNSLNFTKKILWGQTANFFIFAHLQRFVECLIRADWVQNFFSDCIYWDMFNLTLHTGRKNWKILSIQKLENFESERFIGTFLTFYSFLPSLYENSSLKHNLGLWTIFGRFGLVCVDKAAFHIIFVWKKFSIMQKPIFRVIFSKFLLIENFCRNYDNTFRWVFLVFWSKYFSSWNFLNSNRPKLTYLRGIC